MPTSFPAAFDAFTNPNSGDALTSPSHAGQHSDANDAVEALEVVVGRTGTSFPGSPATGATFWRTDRHLDYFYDGTRWLSRDLYAITLPTSDALAPVSATGTINRVGIHFPGTYALWLEQAWLSVYVVTGGSALGASHKWVIVLAGRPSNTTYATFNLDSGASATFRNFTPVTVNAVSATTDFELDAAATKTGTPGNLYAWPSFTYRLIG